MCEADSTIKYDSDSTACYSSGNESGPLFIRALILIVIQIQKNTAMNKNKSQMKLSTACVKKRSIV